MKFFELEMDGVARIFGEKKFTRPTDMKCKILINKPDNGQPTQTIKK